MRLLVALMFIVDVAYGSDLPYFMIKHRTSGKCLKPYLYDDTTSDPVQFFPCKHQDDMIYQFQSEFEQWGYIKHIFTGDVIHPKGGEDHPDDGTRVVIHSDRHWGALFALDAVNERVTHKSGKHIHPHNGNRNPWDGDYCTIHSGHHDATKFLFISPYDLETEVLVYGMPRMSGHWERINSVENATALHKKIKTIKVGKSQTDSVTSTFQYSWETSAGFDIGILSASATQTFTFMMEKASSATWYEETETTREITVEPGQTVATWQYVFTFEQGNHHKSVFQSNMIADTDSPTKVPDYMEYSV